MPTDKRRVTGRLLLAFNVAVANVAALVCVVGFLRPSTVGVAAPGVVAGLPQQRIVILLLETTVAWGVFLAGLTVLVLNVWWLLRRPRSQPVVNYVLSETASGPVRVGREALESGLRAAGEALPEITRLRVVVDPGAGRRVRVLAQFQCAEGVSNLQASQRLRSALQERLASMVRLGDGGRVDYEIEFLGFAGKLPRKGEGPPPEEPPPFTGPRYPIEEEETSGGAV